MSVLITDGVTQHSLAAVRSLGKKGLELTVTDNFPLAQSFFSKYCHHRYRTSVSNTNPIKFISELKSILKRHKQQVLLPIGWDSNYYISQFRKMLTPYTKIPLAEPNSMETAANKDKTMRFASKLGINCPDTYYPKNIDDLKKITKLAPFPLIIKSSISSKRVYYVKNAKQLYSQFQYLKESRPIVQEFIKGGGYGFFALYNKGKCRAYFMHKRLREFPLTGGPSAAAMSFRSGRLKQQGMKLLDELKWHGVAMVEFKRDEKDGKFKLLEINPKFWGSLELAIKSGIDFPYLAYKMEVEGDIKSKFTYKEGVEFRWPFPKDFLHFLYAHNLLAFVKQFGFRSSYVCFRFTHPFTLFL
jgi:predicted ATP-grasp superfamily ATP-dependent carboligase